MRHLGAAGRQILLVEDNQGDADLIVEYLAEPGASRDRIVHVNCLAAAMDSLASRPVDAVLLDLQLPDGMGVDCVAAVRACAQHVPIVVLTGLDDHELALSCLAAGAQDYIPKCDVRPQGLRRAIAYAIARVRELAEGRRADALQSRLADIVEASNDAIVSTTIEGVVTSWNRGAERIFGFSRDEAIGLPVHEVIRPHGGAAAGPQNRGLPGMRRDKTGAGEVMCQHKDGRPVMLSVVDCALHDAAGSVTALAAICRDITERMQAEQLRVRSAELELENRRILEASRMKTEFLANVSHELRTPLNAIIGFSELLFGGHVDPATPKHQEFLGHVLTSSRHLLRLINDLLDLAKVETGKIELRPEPVVLSQLVGEVIDILGTIAAQKRIRVSVAHEPGLAGIRIDPGRFKQILYNYLSNALKFTPDGGQVAVRTSAESNGYFRVEVQDTGPGIAPQDIGRLFGEFQQLESGTTRRHQGTGLGLALTKRLVQAQGGSVAVHSVLGQGSVFSAVLPRRGAQAGGLA